MYVLVYVQTVYIFKMEHVTFIVEDKKIYSLFMSKLQWKGGVK